MLLKPQWLFHGAVTLLAVVLMNLPPPAASRIRHAATTLYLPLFGAVELGGTLAARTREVLTPRSRLLARIHTLEEENRALRQRLTQFQEAWEENRRLRELLGWREVSPWRLVPARVMARDTAAWWDTVYIDAGARQGLRPDLPVLAQEGLIGRLGEVGPESAEVILVGSPRCRVAVVVRETGETGVLTTRSAGVWDHRLVDLTYLAPQSALQPGYTVYSSGQGGVFPAGLPVGSIVDWRTVAYGLYTEARVRLFADSSRLREVMVVMP